MLRMKTWGSPSGEAPGLTTSVPLRAFRSETDFIRISSASDSRSRVPAIESPTS